MLKTATTQLENWAENSIRGLGRLTDKLPNEWPLILSHGIVMYMQGSYDCKLVSTSYLFCTFNTAVHSNLSLQGLLRWHCTDTLQRL